MDKYCNRALKKSCFVWLMGNFSRTKCILILIKKILLNTSLIKKPLNNKIVDLRGARSVYSIQNLHETR